MRRFRLLVALGMLSAFGPLSIDMYLPALPTMSRDLHASASLVQLTLTATLLGLALGQIVGGPVSDRRGRRSVLLVGLVIFFVASALCAVAPDAGTLVVFRLLQGLAGAVSLVVARAIVRDLWVGEEMSRVFSRMFLVTGIAPVLAPIIGAQILRFTSWRGTFVLLAGIGLAILVFVALVVPETLRPELRTGHGVLDDLRTFRRILGDRVFAGYSLATGFAYGALFAYIAGSPFVIQDVYGASPTVFSLVFALNAVGLVIGSQLSARLVGKVSMRRLLVVSLVTTCVGAFAVLAGSGLWRLGLAALVPALFVTITSLGLVGPNASALALADYGANAGSASALMGVLQFAVGALTSPLVGVAGKGTALPMGIVMAVQSVLALGCFFLLASARRSRLAPS